MSEIPLEKLEDAIAELQRHERTLFVRESAAEAVRGAVAQLPYAGLLKVVVSDLVPDGKIIVANPTALQLPPVWVRVSRG